MQMWAEERAFCPSCGGQQADGSWCGPVSEMMISTVESEEGGIPLCVCVCFSV